MAQLFICTLSEANSNDIDAQQWLLDNVCNRFERLGKVSLTTTGSTYDEISILIQLLCQTYSASKGDFYGLQEQLQSSLKKYEESYSAEQIDQAHKSYAKAGSEFMQELWDIEQRRELDEEDERFKLSKRPLRYFFKPRR